MRDIRFKAKRLGNDEWVKGDLLHAETFAFITWFENGFRKLEKVDPTTVCQFTGLKDMKGWEIWEHDYIIDFPRCGEVIFVDGVFAMHSDVGDLPLETFVDRVKDNPLKTYGNCLVTSQGSRFDKKGGE
mgnify:CR=1 FL=1